MSTSPEELRQAGFKRTLRTEMLRGKDSDPKKIASLNLLMAASKQQARRLAASPETSTPLVEKEAQGNTALDVQQRAAVIGEPIPIVFARRVSSVGGVLISPPATEARFTDDASSNITASYHLVLSEGQIDSIQVRDVFQRSCRVGSFSQTYGRRAGTFIPGNFIDNTPNLEAPYYCGTSGTYSGMSTMAYSVTIPAGFDQWNRQVHCFVRGGMRVTRLLDSVTGPSNNVADLLLYLLRNSSRVPEAQIDTTSLLAGATFTNANGLWFNGVVSESTNLRDWIGDVLPYFLLRQTRVAGKEALKPLLPTNSNGTIKTTAVDWKFVFTEQHVIPESFEISYTPLADRKPVCVMVLWRQQDDLGIPVMRTAEVRYQGTAIDGPYEQHDLSGFCASENHAVKVGTYILSKRRHVTHRLQIGVRPDGFNETLTAGDRVRVRLDRVASTGAASVHDYLYEVDRIGKSLTGEVTLELTHFPIDSSFASVVAKEVNGATGAGYVIPTGLTGVTCDVNSSGDTSVPADTSLDPGDWNLPGIGSFETDITKLDPIDLDAMTDADIDNLAIGGVGGLGGGGYFGGGGGGGDGSGVSGGGLDGQIVPSTGAGDITTPNNPPLVGDAASVPVICEGGRVNWYRLDPSVEGGKVYLTQGPTYTMVINDVDYSVYAETECPDPSSPTGYGPPIPWNPTDRIYPAPDLPGANIYGTYSPTGLTTIYFRTIGWSSKRAIAGCVLEGGTSPSISTSTVVGLQAFRVVGTPSAICDGLGYNPIGLQVQNAAGTWTQIAGISGGTSAFYDFIGSLELASSAPDAMPAYLGNFGGTSTPP